VDSDLDIGSDLESNTTAPAIQESYKYNKQVFYEDEREAKAIDY
jgi:hypothetical protein